jgi:hypothetical protein
MGDRLFRLSGVLGLGALIMTGVLALIGPRRMGALPAGFVTPVVAFEFARTEAEVRGMFGPAEDVTTRERIRAMDRVNRWDFLYMALYNSFLATFALACARQTGRRVFTFLALLPVVILFADALENVQLLGLTRQLALGGQLNTLLARLSFFTWLKWGGLTLYCLLIAPYFWRLGGRWRWAAAAGPVPALFAVVALFMRGLPHELMALAIGVMFLLMTIYAFAGGKWQVAGKRE